MGQRGGGEWRGHSGLMHGVSWTWARPWGVQRVRLPHQVTWSVSIASASGTLSLRATRKRVSCASTGS